MKRSLTVFSADADIVTACQKAAALVPEAIGDFQVIASLMELAEQTVDGLVVVDPAVFAPLSVQEWSLDFLRNHRALLFLLTQGDLADADGLARFVGAQGAVSLPIQPEALADLLASPFGAPRSVKPAPAPSVDAETLGESLTAMLGNRIDEDREVFLRHITDAETGLFASDYWEHRLDEEFKRSNRFRFPLGLVAFSMDGEVADARALEVASIILLDTRDVDVAARWDHRTFVALLPHTGPAGVALFAERVTQGLKKLGLKDLMSETVEWEASVGVCPDASLVSAQAFLQSVLPQPA